MISKLYLACWLLTNGQQQLLDKACRLLTNGQQQLVDKAS
jgi:hypothetical protein